MSVVFLDPGWFNYIKCPMLKKKKIKFKFKNARNSKS